MGIAQVDVSCTIQQHTYSRSISLGDDTPAQLQAGPSGQTETSETLGTIQRHSFRALRKIRTGSQVFPGNSRVPGVPKTLGYPWACGSLGLGYPEP